MQPRPFRFIRLCVLALGFAPTPVWAQANQKQPAPATPQPAPPAPPDTQLELPTPPQSTPAETPTENLSEISLDQWTRDDWELVPPKNALLELDGYMRMRGDLLRKLDFNNAPALERTPRYVSGSDGKANFTSTNMRLRLIPTINVTDDIHIVSTIDVFDNLVLGTSPNSPYVTGAANNVPINVLDRGQRTLVRGDNSLADSIAVKRVYARVTALNEQLELRFGRMPSQWGLGILSNAGDCLDCDYGDTVDRLQLTAKIGERGSDLMFIGAYDWVSTGPLASPFGRSGGQPLDAVTWDDVEQYSLRVLRADAPEDITERVSAGESVFNYGGWVIWRRQFRDQQPSYYADPNAPDESVGTGHNFERRNSNVFTGDGFLKLRLTHLEIGTEGAIIWGSFRDTGVHAGELERTSVYQVGGAMELTWHFNGEYKGTQLSLKAGGASGDSARYFGALDQAGTQRGPTDTGKKDMSLQNFQFSPDYHVDLLLFRHIIGTVTDAWYIRPEVSHDFNNNITGSLATIYSQAIFKNSTPGKHRPMGLEVDTELAYGSEQNKEAGAFRGAIAGGLLFPFGAFKNHEPDAETNPSFAWTLQGRLYITF